LLVGDAGSFVSGRLAAPRRRGPGVRLWGHCRGRATEL